MFILTIHYNHLYNHLFFVWLIMNCVDYKNTKNAHILILLFMKLE